MDRSTSLNHVAKPRTIAIAVLLCIHTCLLAYVAFRNSPNPDEVANLPAGIYVWQCARFDLYCVNPPLVRTWAAIPAVLLGSTTDWSEYSATQGHRTEWSLGRSFFAVNGGRAFWLCTFGRWMCIPFSILGAWVCSRWATELYGEPSGVVAATVWCFSPNMIGWGSTTMPDVPASAFGVTACYAYWRWLQAPRWPRAFAAGIMLGLAELTKMTWIVLFAVWPLVWALWILSYRKTYPRSLHSSLQVPFILFLGVYVLNLGYAFDGTGTRLADFTFVSRSLAGTDSSIDGGGGGNLFKGTVLGHVPVPLPRDYLRGLDIQKSDFERGMPSFLLGQVESGGRWYYYLACAVFKIPLGTWMLGLLAAMLTAWSIGRQMGAHRCASLRSCYYMGTTAELVLLLPAIVVFVLVSSQTGICRFFRYAFPALPFVFIWISKSGRSLTLGHRNVGRICVITTCWLVVSSLMIYPHSMSYFNELTQGPRGGHAYLVDANIDWQQDMWYLKEWFTLHPQSRPLYVIHHGHLKPACFGITPCRVPDWSHNGIEPPRPLPGWYAMSVHRMRVERDKTWNLFLHRHPIAMAGYSMYIYRVTLNDATTLRETVGHVTLPARRNGAHTSGPSEAGDYYVPANCTE